MKLNKHFLFVFILIIFCSFCSEKTSAQKQFIARGDAYYPPYEYIDDEGNTTGFNVDLLREVAKEMNLNIEIKLGKWNTVKEQLKNKEIDIITGMFYSKERKKLFDFSLSFINVSHSLFVLPESSISNLKNLNNKKISVQEDDIMHEYALKNLKNSIIIPVRDPQISLEGLHKKKYDGVILSRYQSYFFNAKNDWNNIKGIDLNFKQKEYCFAVVKGNKKLLNKLNEGLGILKQKGKYDELYKKWFGNFNEKANDNKFFEQIIVVFFSLIFLAILIILAFFVWTRSLKKQVAKKTHLLQKELNDRKETQKILANSKARYKQLLELIPYGIVECDTEGIILYGNKAYHKLVEYEEKNLTGQHIWYPYSNKKRIQNLVCTLLKTTPQPRPYIFQGKTKSNEVRTFKVIWDYEYDQDENLKGLICIYSDITKSKEVEQKLKEAKEKAEQADKMKSDFLANMSHEIRTPMNAIIGFSDLLIDNELTKKTRHEYINFIRSNGRSLLNLIEDIIDIARIEAGKIKIEKKTCKIDNILQELYANNQEFKSKLQKEDIQLILKKPQNSELFYLHTDQFRFRQVFSNLLVNAIKFTSNGFIEFGYEQKDEQYLEFYVKDTGIGISENSQKYIFDRFKQIKDKKISKQQGTGLGLAITKNLINLLGGSIWVESQYGKGSIFKFDLPYILEDKNKNKNSNKTEEKFDWSNKTILIAEDILLNYRVLEMTLNKTNAKIIWAKNGREAVEIFKESNSIDLILMDLQMPEMNGYEATKSIKRIRNIPIIAQTAYAMSDEKNKSMEIGFDDYITKPIQKDILLNAISKYFDFIPKQ